MTRSSARLNNAVGPATNESSVGVVPICVAAEQETAVRQRHFSRIGYWLFRNDLGVGAAVIAVAGIGPAVRKQVADFGD